MKILVAVSSNREEDADPVAAAAAFPWPPGSMVRVVSVAEIFQPALAAVGPDAAAVPVEVDTVRNAAKTAATDAAHQLQGLGDVTGIVLEGDPRSVIPDYAREWRADIIVIGAPRRSAIERLLAGSVSLSIVKNAPCSVLAIRDAEAA